MFRDSRDAPGFRDPDASVAGWGVGGIVARGTGWISRLRDFWAWGFRDFAI